MRISYSASFVVISLLTKFVHLEQVSRYRALSHEERNHIIDEHVEHTKAIIEHTLSCDGDVQIMLGAGLYQSYRIIDQVLTARKESTSGGLTGDDHLDLERSYFGDLTSVQKKDLTNVFKVVAAKLPQTTWECDDTYSYESGVTAYVKGPCLEGVPSPEDIFSLPGGRSDLKVYIAPRFTGPEYTSLWHMLTQPYHVEAIRDVPTRPRVMMHELMHLASCKAGGAGMDLPQHITDHVWPFFGPIADVGDCKCRSEHLMTDRVYGPFRSRDLARYWPEYTFTNADNYVMYAIDLVHGARNGVESLRVSEQKPEETINWDVERALSVDEVIAKEVGRRLRRDGCIRHSFSWSCPRKQQSREHDEL